VRKDSLVKSAVDIRKIGQGHAGSPLMFQESIKSGRGMVGALEFVTKSDDTVVSGTTLVDDPDLTYSLEKNSIYRFVAHLEVTYINGTGGFKYLLKTGTAVVNRQFSHNTLLWAGGSMVNYYLWFISGIITTVAADTLQLQWAQQVNSGNTTMSIKSFLVLVRMRQT
jgi:hypothetical protein